MPPRAKLTLSDQAREIIASRGLTAYAVARASGVDVRAVSRWLKQERDFATASLDKIGEALGLRLVEVGQRNKSPKIAQRPASNDG